MEFLILGPLEVWTEGRQLPLVGAKQRAVLGLLLLHRNRVVATERLIDDLWGDHPPETPAAALQMRISGLRKVLEGRGAREGPSQVLITRPPGYLLRVEPDGLDADPDADSPKLTGVHHPAASTLTVARATASRISAFGYEIAHAGKSGFSAPFSWAG